jgi:Zn-dependent protease with chaperone function
MIVVIMAMVTAGLFAGVWWHNSTGVGDDWQRTVARCEASTGGLSRLSGPGAVDGALARNADFQRCTRPAEERRALFSLGGAGVVGLGMIVTTLAMPGIIIRRRKLAAFPERLARVQEQVTALARDGSLHRPPELLLGPSVQRDAFSFGVPGRYRIALPPKVAVTAARPTSQAVIRHELAHVGYGDVPLAWLARSAGYVLVPLLGVPAVIDLARGSFGFAVDYGPRATVLGLVGWLTQSAWLRSREHVADLRAARGLGSPAAVIDALGAAAPPSTTGSAPWRRLIAAHPVVPARAEVLRNPAMVAPVTFVDGLTVAFFASVLLPSLRSVLTAGLTGTGRQDLVEFLTAVLVGTLLAGTLGLGLWRQSLMARMGGSPLRPRRVAAGAALGTAVGQLTSLGNAGTLQSTGAGEAVAVLIPAAALAGATVLAAGLGELWADAAGSIPRPRGSWLPAIALTGTLFAFALWAGGYLLLAAPLGWNGISQLLALQFGTWPGWVSALVVAAGAVLAAAIRTGPARRAPGWLVERGEPAPWPVVRWLAATLRSGPLAGAAGGAAIVVYRLLVGADLGASEQRYYTYLLVSGTSGAVVAAILIVGSRTRGYGAALVAAPLASVVAALFFVALNTALGGALTPGFTWAVLKPALGLQLTLAMLLGGLLPLGAERPEPAPARPGVGRATGAMAVTALVPALVAVAVLVAGRSLIPWAGAGPAQNAPATAGEAVAAYVGKLAPAITAAYTAVDRQRQAIADSGLPAGQQADLLRRQVIPALAALAGEAEQFTSSNTSVQAAHRDCVTALRAAVAGSQAQASVLSGDGVAIESDVTVLRAHETSSWRAWRADLVILGE